MIRILTAAVFVALLSAPLLVYGRGGSHHASYSSRSYYRHSSTYRLRDGGYRVRWYSRHSHSSTHRSQYERSAADSYRSPRWNHEHRSFEAKLEFWRMTGYPRGRPGYVVDHIIPLACGGADGVRDLLTGLTDDLAHAMALAGAPSVAEIPGVTQAAPG